MKYLFLFFISIAVFSSCSKKTNTVTVTKNDTLTVRDTLFVQASLIGTWNSSTGASPLVFTSSTYQLQSFPTVTYLASIDTIYDISQTNIVYEKWAYTISGNNDTLYLTMLPPATVATNVYIKS
jgi:hypothetical protein